MNSTVKNTKKSTTSTKKPKAAGSSKTSAKTYVEGRKEEVERAAEHAMLRFKHGELVGEVVAYAHSAFLLIITCIFITAFERPTPLQVTLWIIIALASGVVAGSISKRITKRVEAQEEKDAKEVCELIDEIYGGKK